MRVADKSHLTQRMTSNHFKTLLLFAALTVAGAARAGEERAVMVGHTAVWRADIDTGGEHVAAKFLLCTYVARVKEKLLFIQLHAPQLTAGDYRWVSEVCDRYVDDIVATNKVERLKRMVPSRPAPALPSSSAAAAQ